MTLGRIDSIGQQHVSVDHFKPNPAPLPAEPEDSSDDSDSDTYAEFVAGKVEGANIGFEELSLSVLMVNQFACLVVHICG